MNSSVKGMTRLIRCIFKWIFSESLLPEM